MRMSALLPFAKLFADRLVPQMSTVPQAEDKVLRATTLQHMSQTQADVCFRRSGSESACYSGVCNILLSCCPCVALTLARFIDDLQRRIARLEKDEDELSSPRSFVDQDRARPEDGRTFSHFLGAGLTSRSP